jgi:hypothetical protein
VICQKNVSLNITKVVKIFIVYFRVSSRTNQKDVKNMSSSINFCHPCLATLLVLPKKGRIDLPSSNPGLDRSVVANHERGLRQQDVGGHSRIQRGEIRLHFPNKHIKTNRLITLTVITLSDVHSITFKLQF